MSRVSGVEQSTSGEDERGSSQTGALPEGADLSEGDPADPSRRDELPPFPTSRKSAGTLDLAASSDEPTQLIRMLVVAAREHIGESENDSEWKVLLSYFEKANNELMRMQDPSHKRVKHGTL